MIDAQEAFRIGLVNGVVPAAELLPQCERVAGEILARGPIAVRFAMDAAIRGLETDFWRTDSKWRTRLLRAGLRDRRHAGGAQGLPREAKPTFTGV